MTATRVATATLVALVALTCDITEVEGPPADNPDAEPGLTPWIAQGLFELNLTRDLINQLNSRLIRLEEMLVAYQDMPMSRYDDREAEENPDGETTENRGETTPAISQLAPQTIVESESPREADLVLADEPLVRVGLLDPTNSSSATSPVPSGSRTGASSSRTSRSSRSESSTPAGGTFGRAGGKARGRANTRGSG